MLAADVAAVANARCVGLIMETTAQSVCECFLLCVVEVMLKSCSYRPQGPIACATRVFTDVGRLSRIICEQVG